MRKQSKPNIKNNPQEVIWSKSLLKLACLEQVAQYQVQSALEYLQGWGVSSLSGQSVPVLSHPHGMKIFPCALTEPPMNRKINGMVMYLHRLT